MTTNGQTPAPSKSIRFDRASWVALGISVFFVTLLAAFVWLHLGTPSDGARLQPGTEAWRPEGVVITPLREQVDGLHAGDLVIAIDGRPLESWAQALVSKKPRPQWERGQTLTYTVVRDGQTVDVSVRLVTYPLGSILTREWGPILFSVVFLLVAMFVFLKRPAEPSAQVLLIGTCGIMSASTWSLGAQVSDMVGGIGLWLFAATTLVGYMLLWISLVHLWFVFPKPHPVLQQRRWIVPLLYVIPYAFFTIYGFATWLGSPSTLDWLGRFLGSYRPLDLSYAVLGLSAAVWRYKIPMEAADRREMRLVWSAMILVLSLSVPFTLLPRLVSGEPLLSINVMAVLGLLFPVSLAITILRYRLFDIEVIVNRTLLYGILTAIVVSVYILVVGSLGALFQARGNLGISLLAVGLVAVLLQPLRQWLQRFINRWMYGQRDDPYGVLTHLGRRLEGAVPVESVLPAIVDTVAEALKIPYVAIMLNQQEEQVVVAAHGQSIPDTLRLPLVYQGEEIGQMLLAPRAKGEAFNKADWKLLSDLARHAGVVAHSVRLTGDLRRARERLVVSREEERRRLRRDLHDGLGPLLGSMMLKLDATRNMLSRDPKAADVMLDDVKAQTQQALADIRRLAYALRPPALDQLGLVTALREYALGLQPAHQGKLPESNSLQVSIETTTDLPPLPAAVEVAAYRIAVEALTNVARHSHACNCVVRLSMSDGGILELEVSDDGTGLPSDFKAGVGITSMKERASELGGGCVIGVMPNGGTRVLARIPAGVHRPVTATNEGRS